MIKSIFKALFFLSLLLSLQSTFAQEGNDIFAADDDDLNIGGDIFTDFNEDVDNAKIVEDERFYRFGRFFSFNASIGLTTFDGTRGIAYENFPPTYGISFTFFKDFQTALNLGLSFSKHSFFLGGPTVAFPYDSPGPGTVESNLLRVHLGYRYYVDTSDLGTAITYANPYFVGQLEYWYQTLHLVDQSQEPKRTGGGLGVGLGFGLEFPIEIKESYWGLEFLFHSVNFPDKNVNWYQANPDGGPGYDDMAGNAYSTMLSYVFNW